MTEGAQASNTVSTSETSQDKSDSSPTHEESKEEESAASLPLEVRLERADQLLKV